MFVDFFYSDGSFNGYFTFSEYQGLAYFPEILLVFNDPLQILKPR